MRYLPGYLTYCWQLQASSCLFQPLRPCGKSHAGRPPSFRVGAACRETLPVPLHAFSSSHLCCFLATALYASPRLAKLRLMFIVPRLPYSLQSPHSRHPSCSFPSSDVQTCRPTSACWPAPSQTRATPVPKSCRYGHPLGFRKCIGRFSPLILPSVSYLQQAGVGRLLTLVVAERSGVIAHRMAISCWLVTDPHV